MKKCLILGGNGFLGSHLAEGLVEKGYDVRVFDSFQTGMENLETVRGRVEIMEGDFFSEADVRQALKGMDYVFHYVGTTVPATAVKDPIHDIEASVVGTVRLLQLAVESEVKRVIFPSSGGTIYGEPDRLPVPETHALNPIDPYGISRLAIEKYLHYFHRAYGLDHLILRYSNPYGERQNPHGQQGVIAMFLNRIKMGERPVIYGDGSMERDYIYVGDAVEATIAALEKRTPHRVFNVGSGAGTSLNHLLELMSIVTGRKIEPVYVEDTTVRVQKIVLDTSRIREEIGWKPHTALREGMDRTWRWITRL